MGIVYLLTHMQLAARLVVSLHSLRKWYHGPIAVFTTRPESHEIGRLLAADKRLGVAHHESSEVIRDDAHASAYLTKVAFLPQSPFPCSVFLDADTLIVGPLDELLQRAQRGALTVTLFDRICTTDPLVAQLWPLWRRAIAGCATPSRWLPLVDRVAQYSYPSVNTGVFAFQRDAPVLKEWYELAWVGRDIATPDESALQLLLVRYSHQMLGCHFNCVPHLARNVSDVRILHFAAASHLRFPETRDLWLAAYRECQSLNLAKLQEWHSVESP